MNNTVELRHLSIGEEFTIPSLPELKTLVKLRDSASGILSLVKSKREHFPCSMPVKSLGNIRKIICDSWGLPKLLKEEITSETTQEQKDIIKKASNGKRGRPRKTDSVSFEWPKQGVEFSIKELAEKLGIQYVTVANAFNKERCNFKQVRQIKNSSGRGRATTIWTAK